MLRKQLVVLAGVASIGAACGDHRDQIDLAAYQLAADRVRDSTVVALGRQDWDTQKALRQGWSYRESGWGTTFSWVDAPRAEIVLSSFDGGDSTLRFRARGAPGIVPSQALRLRLNGHSVGQVVLGEEWQEHALEVPAAVVRRGRNRLELLFRRTGVGAEGDERRLAAAFDFVRFEPTGLQLDTPTPVWSMLDAPDAGPLRLAPGEGRRWLLRLDSPNHLHLALRCDPQIGAQPLRLWLKDPALREEPAVAWERSVCAEKGATGIETVEVPLPEIAGTRELTLLQPRTGTAAVVVEKAILQRRRREDPPRQPNAVLLVLDALRADHIHGYGYARPTTRWIDRLSAESVLFEHAVAQAPFTIASLPSILTGKYPPSHGVIASTRLDARFPTWPEKLRDGGYRTFAVSANPFFSSDFGLDRGFEVLRPLWAETPSHRRGLDDVVPAEVVVESVTRILREVREPFLLVAHFMQPHAPYAPPPPFLGSFGPPSPHFDGSEVTLVKARPSERRSLLQAVTDRYDENLLYVDSAVGRLVQQLRLLALLDRTTLIVAADHGEQLLERGDFGHPAQSLHDESIRVPLIVRLPDASPGRRVASPVQLIDIGPTFLELAGLPPTLGAGRSLLRHATADAPADDAAFSFAVSTAFDPVRPFRWAAIRTAGWKIIDKSPIAVPELFDLAHDPGERRASYLAEGSTARTGEPGASRLQRLAELRKNLEGEEAAAPAVLLDETTAARLRALGYLANQDLYSDRPVTAEEPLAR